MNIKEIMDFYDTSLETAIDHDNWQEFQHALSGIGEALASRFALEDKLILLTWKNELHENARRDTVNRSA